MRIATALAAVLLAAAPAAFAQTTLALPEGPLQMVSGRKEIVFFIAMDSVRRQGDVVAYNVYGVWLPPQTFDNVLVAQDVSRWEINCKTRQGRDGGVVAYDPAGKAVITLPAAPDWAPIGPTSATEFQRRVLCDGVKLPAENTLQGYQAATEAAKQAQAQSRLPGS